MTVQMMWIRCTGIDSLAYQEFDKMPAGSYTIIATDTLTGCSNVVGKGDIIKNVDQLIDLVHISCVPELSSLQKTETSHCTALILHMNVQMQMSSA